MPLKQPTIHVVRPGLFTTIQDLGRVGYQRFGVSVSGAMDPWALTVGNRLLGNPDRTAGLEITLHGPELLFEDALSIAITGADLNPTSNGVALPMWTVVRMPAGSRLEFGMRRHGTRAYLTVAGGIDGPLMLGSRSTHVRSGIGGVAGRALRKWDRLNVRPARVAGKLYVGRTLPEAQRPRYQSTATIRVIPGPQADRFTDDALEILASQPYRLASESDRMGYRLQGLGGAAPHLGRHRVRCRECREHSSAGGSTADSAHGRLPNDWGICQTRDDDRGRSRSRGSTIAGRQTLVRGGDARDGIDTASVGSRRT
jgi:antagonist of KipI